MLPRDLIEDRGLGIERSDKVVVVQVTSRHQHVGRADAARPLEFLAQVLVERDLLAPLVTRGMLRFSHHRHRQHPRCGVTAATATAARRY
jgi:hypothetical protein